MNHFIRAGKLVRLALVTAAAFVLLAVQTAPVVTVRDCLLRSGYSRSIPATPVTLLAGVEAWGGGVGERVLREGANVGMAYLEDGDGATRMVGFHVWQGNVYLFVYKHPSDPARRLLGEPRGVYHGDCLLRITGGAP